MNGARAERNEYLLSHTFYNEQFICPDKPSKNKSADYNIGKDFFLYIYSYDVPTFFFFFF